MMNETSAMVVRNGCECGRGPIVCQGECLKCRAESEAKYCAENGLVLGATGVGRVYGKKFHKLTARRVVWGGVPTLRWVAGCAVVSQGYGSPEAGAVVDCKRCS
jgi:hypothetical protein